MGAGSTGSGDRGTAQGLRLIAGFESTYSPLSDVDCFETTGHDRRWQAGLESVRASGVTELRHPLLRPRIESEPGRDDWRLTDAVLGHAPILRAVLPAVLRAGAVWRELLPGARHAWVDTCEHHAGGTAAGRAQAELADDRRFALLDLALGRPRVEPPAADVVDPLVLVPETVAPVPLPPEPSQEDAMHARNHAAVPRPSRGPDLVVLSHLRWQFVWQRPQHLLTRITAARAGDGGRTWFVEEPHATPDADAPRLATEQHGDITRVWLEVPVADGTPEGRLDFAVPEAQDYAQLLTELLAAHDAGPTGPRPGPPKPAPQVWLYTPMALDIAEALEPDLLVYDVMDDLSAFAKAPAGLRLRQRRALRLADVVLAGGRSLHASVATRRPDAHLFPSGVESRHYARSRSLRPAEPREHPVAGFVGVVDERLDGPLLAEVAGLLPDWDFRLVGPVAEFKMDPGTLPQAPNLHYLGARSYDELPAVMAEFDVALMPFAINEATRSISPTKTLEYLAAGLPVVSTPVPDVVADFSGLVQIASTAWDFAAACERAAVEPVEHRDQALRRIARRYEWDDIAARIHRIMQDALSASGSEVAGRARTGVTA